MHKTTRTIESGLQNNLLSLTPSQITYQNAIANYRIENQSTIVLKITITLRLNTQEQIIGIAYYDKNLKKMVKWLEKN